MSSPQPRIRKLVIATVVGIISFVVVSKGLCEVLNFTGMAVSAAAYWPLNVGLFVVSLVAALGLARLTWRGLSGRAVGD